MTRFGKIGQNAQLAILGLLPIAALFGNAAADIALVLTVIIYLSTERDAFTDLRQSRFFQLAFVFWVWICICSAVSMFPKNSFQDSLPWIRFPIYAYILSHLCSIKNKGTNIFILSSIIGMLLQVGFILYQFISRRLPGAETIVDYYRIYGTYSKSTAGWYTLCFGIIISVFLFEKLIKNKLSTTNHFFYFIILMINSIGMILTGEINNSALYFGCIAFVLFLRSPKNLILNKKIIIYFMVTILIIFLIIVSDNGLYYRISANLSSRLNWSNTSDFKNIYSYCIEIILSNWIFGIGPKNTYNYCEWAQLNNIIDLNLFGLTKCPWHPHNFYIQIASETGLIGLLFWIALPAYLIIKSIKNISYSNSAFSMIFIFLMPLQTYSQAFGQFKNFFLWTVIGYAISQIKNKI